MSKAKPTAKQIEWANAEFGAIIHYDLTVYEQYYQYNRPKDRIPDIKNFTPTALQTDQWVKAAKDAGATYIVLVAKHCIGFALFKSDANDYNVRTAPYNKDIVESFVKSCKKYNIKPGVYYSTGCNAYETNKAYLNKWDEKTELEEYNKVLKTQLEELWGNYGEWFELWFDGGTKKVSEGGLDITPLLEKYQPNAITFQGDRLHDENNTRWVGNERGMAPFNCFATINGESQSDGVVENKNLGTGDKDGKFWRQGECDAPMWKHNQWFYKDGKEKWAMSSTEIMEMYYNSVGKNCNLLLGIMVDRRGLVPEKDVAILKEVGEKIKNTFKNPISKTKGKGNEILLDLKSQTQIDHIVLKEDITNGHSVFEYKIEAKTNSGWKTVFEAQAIGHKRIARIKPVTTSQLRLVITKNDGDVNITEFSAYYVNNYSLKQKIMLMKNGYLK